MKQLGSDLLISINISQDYGLFMPCEKIVASDFTNDG